MFKKEQSPEHLKLNQLHGIKHLTPQPPWAFVTSLETEESGLGKKRGERERESQIVLCSSCGFQGQPSVDLRDGEFSNSVVSLLNQIKFKKYLE